MLPPPRDERELDYGLCRPLCQLLEPHLQLRGRYRVGLDDRALLSSHQSRQLAMLQL